MNFIEHLNRLIGFYITLLKTVHKLKIWWPFFLYALIQLCVLLLCSNYSHPSLYPTLSPLIGLIGGLEARIFSHYPGMYLMLPIVFQWGKLIVSLVFEGLAVGLTVTLFLNVYNMDGGRKISETFRFWPQLFAGWLIITLILFAVNWYIPPLLIDYVRGSPRRRLLFDFSLKGLTIAIYSLFIYTLPALIIFKKSLMSALGYSFKMFVRHPFYSFFLALIPYLLSLPTSYLSGQAEIIILKFRPELIFYILLAGIIVDMIINYTLAGTVTKFIIDDDQK